MALSSESKMKEMQERSNVSKYIQEHEGEKEASKKKSQERRMLAKSNGIWIYSCWRKEEEAIQLTVKEIHEQIMWFLPPQYYEQLEIYGESSKEVDNHDIEGKRILCIASTKASTASYMAQSLNLKTCKANKREKDELLHSRNKRVKLQQQYGR